MSQAQIANKTRATAPRAVAKGHAPRPEAARPGRAKLPDVWASASDTHRVSVSKGQSQGCTGARSVAGKRAAMITLHTPMGGERVRASP